MCGRFTLTVDPSIVQLQFSLESIPASFTPRYNIAPTQPVLALTNEGGRDTQMLRWGLIPSWAKDPKIGSKLINARSETLAEKPSFRNAFKRRRCVIFADGFYEWQKGASGSKTPMYIRLNDGQPFLLAGLWEMWKPAEGDEWLRTCTIITTSANDFMAPIHNRMPVILERPAMDDWLTPGEIDPLDFVPLLQPYDSAAFSAYPVSRAVNSPANESPALIAPAPQQDTLL